MKLRKILACVSAAFAILIATNAFAADKGTMKLFDPTTVSGAQLAAGDYQLQWEGTGSEIQLKVLRGNKVVATAPATIVQLNAPAARNMTSTRAGNNNERALTEISFQGRTYALSIGNDSSPKSDADVAKK